MGKRNLSLSLFSLCTFYVLCDTGRGESHRWWAGSLTPEPVVCPLQSSVTGPEPLPVSLRNQIGSLPSLSSNSLKLKVKPHLNSFWRLAWYTDQYLTLRHQRPALAEGVGRKGTVWLFPPTLESAWLSLPLSWWWFVDIEQPLGTRRGREPGVNILLSYWPHFFHESQWICSQLTNDNFSCLCKKALVHSYCGFQCWYS